MKNKVSFVLFINVFMVVLLIIAKSFFAFKMQTPYVFSDEQSYFGMIDKIVNFNFNKITNSHQPGVSLIYSLGYLFANNSYQAYHNVLLINSIIGALAFPISFYACYSIFNLKIKDSIFVAMIISISPSVISYNNLVLSETLQTILYLLVFVMICDFVVKKNLSSIKMILLGFAMGFLPIVKAQALITLFFLDVFILCYFVITNRQKNTFLNKKILLHVFYISVSVYVFFKFILFNNLSGYSDQRGDNLRALLHIVDSVDSFGAFFHIFFAELALLFVFTGIIPLVYLITWLIENAKKYFGNNKEVSFAYIIVVFFYAIL